MRALKTLVVVMGVMLVVGVVVLVVAIADRLAHRHPHASETARSVVSLHGERHAIPLPAGAKVLGVEGDGPRVVLRLALGNGEEELWLLDWRTGARLATIDLEPAGGAGRAP